MAKTVPQLWITQLGLVACQDHGGNYLQTAVKANPARKAHSTPLNDWAGFTAAELAHIGADPATIECETCGAVAGDPA